jgi:hypothetical protein
MRRAINDNPVVQAGLVGVMVILFAFLLFTRVLNRDSGSEPTPPDATTPVTGTESSAGAAATAAPETAAPETTAPDAAVPEASAPAPATGAPPAGEFVAGKGLPEGVVEAYENGDAVALLIVTRGGIDDKLVQASVEDLELRDDVSVFVTGAKDIARYSQITQGVSVNRTPALVVVGPRNLDQGTPEASVSYGFRGPESIAQAIRDALYKGKEVPYYPE